MALKIAIPEFVRSVRKQFLKHLTIVFSLVIVGCGTISGVRKAFMSDPGVSEGSKLEYLKHEAAAAQFKPYHYLAIGLIVLGVYSVVGKGSTNVGIGVAVSGVAVSAWALFATTHPREVAIGIGILFFLAVIAIVLRMLARWGVIKRKRNGKTLV